MGGGASKQDRAVLLAAVNKGDVWRTREHLERLRGSAASVINSTKDSDGINLLCAAVKRNSESMVMTLLEFRADANQACGQAKSTPLLLVAEFMPEELTALSVARALLDARANINYSNLFDQTALFSCAMRPDQGLVAYYLSRGAKVNHWNKVFGKSLLMEFFTTGALNGGKLTTLIDAGAELHPTERQRVLHVAAAQQDDQVLRIVLDKTGAGKPHIEARNEVGETTVHLVCKTRTPSLDAVRLLLAARVDIEVCNGRGHTPLMTCIQHNTGAEVIEFLLQQRADPNHATPTNTTALIKCCQEWPDPSAVARALLARGANINHQENVTRSTALHVLAQRSDMDTPGVLAVADMLIQRGAMMDIQDAQGQLPLHVCYASCARERRGVRGGPFLSLLLQHATEDDVYAADHAGDAPRDLYVEPPVLVHQAAHEHASSARGTLGAAAAAPLWSGAAGGFAGADGAGGVHKAGEADGVVMVGGRGGAVAAAVDGGGDTGTGSLPAVPVKGDPAIDEYLTTIRVRAGQIAPSKPAAQERMEATVVNGGWGGGRGGFQGHGLRAKSGDLGGVEVPPPPAPVSEQTLQSLRRPNKGPLVKQRV